jgi:hypothetical protein
LNPATEAQILTEHPDLEKDDFTAVYRFVAEAGRFCRQFRIERFQQVLYSFRAQRQTRSPTLESMKMFRLRNGGGEAVRRCARNFREGSMNAGFESGCTVAVQAGGSTPARCAATSTMAAT